MPIPDLDRMVLLRSDGDARRASERSDNTYWGGALAEPQRVPSLWWSGAIFLFKTHPDVSVDILDFKLSYFRRTVFEKMTDLHPLVVIT